jgi:DNA-binding MarR family transcriptional regulator
MNPAPANNRLPFTPRQGQYLAFIHAYTLVLGRPPAEADFRKFFRVTPPTVHQMILSLEKAGLIARQKNTPRSITLKITRNAIPTLEPLSDQPVISSVQRY